MLCIFLYVCVCVFGKVPTFFIENLITSRYVLSPVLLVYLPRVTRYRERFFSLCVNPLHWWGVLVSCYIHVNDILCPYTWGCGFQKNELCMLLHFMGCNAIPQKTRYVMLVGDTPVPYNFYALHLSPSRISILHDVSEWKCNIYTHTRESLTTVYFHIRINGESNLSRTLHEMFSYINKNAGHRLTYDKKLCIRGISYNKCQDFSTWLQ